jgi:2-polyprenyl-3-methyl-5-hydroxy-6-metoxy-1,4-benzoquinol methylase
MKTFNLKEFLKIIRSIVTWWIAEQTFCHLETIREYEIDAVVDLLPKCGRLLEIGAGTGWQSMILKNRGYDVIAIDLHSTKYRENRIWPVIDYDGKHIPFKDKTFDIVFSSNVLEHILDICEFQKEIHRAVTASGRVIHVVPSSSWRFWTNITHIIRYLTMPSKHGEHARNSLTEIYYFGHQRWAQLFRETGWTVLARYSNRLFYTGNSIMDSRLSINTRHKLSYILGGACHIFVLKAESDT